MITKQDKRDLLKSYNIKEITGIETDQDKKIPQPDIEKPYCETDLLIDLCPVKDFEKTQVNFIDVIGKRKSRRKYSEASITFYELSLMLWCTQGIRKVVNNGHTTLRTVPSAEARHPFETYLIVNNVESLNPGLYRYLPLEHKLLFKGELPDIKERLNDATVNQKFISNSAVTFVWAVVPYRSEWSFPEEAYKLIAMDAGHMCQNLYLAAEAVGAGACAVAGYDQDKMDALIGVDGKEEFTIYLAAVGRQL